MADHTFYMDLALHAASAAKGQTDPNPLVGSVIVNDGRIVGIGAHLKAGEPHAEIHALRMAGEQARGGTIYVTLEPCSHHGRTGPCAEAIVEAGLSKVVIAALDPNPLVSGRGVKILKEAGIEVETGVRETESRKLNEVFNKFITTRLPFFTLKAGITLDGKIATHTSDSKWITSEEARRDVHQLRSENGAILVGINTLLKDDPALTARIPNGRNPVRIVLDSSLKIPLDAQVLTDGQAETRIFTSLHHDEQKRKQLEAAGVPVYIAGDGARVDALKVAEQLGEQGVSSVLIEGGGTVNASFLQAELIDKAVLYVAPKLLGGQHAPTFLEGDGPELMRDAVDLEDTDAVKIGKDFKFTGYPVYHGKGGTV